MDRYQELYANVSTQSLKTMVREMRLSQDAAWEEGRYAEHNRLHLHIRHIERELRARARYQTQLRSDPAETSWELLPFSFTALDIKRLISCLSNEEMDRLYVDLATNRIYRAHR